MKHFFMRKDDFEILRMLRNDARVKMTDVAREMNLPKTTVYDKYWRIKQTMITKHSALIDFKKLGNPMRINIAVLANEKEKLAGFLLNHHAVNSVSTVQGYDFFIDAIFPNMAEMHDFMEELGMFKVRKKNVHHIIEELKTEDFLTRKEHLSMI